MKNLIYLIVLLSFYGHAQTSPKENEITAIIEYIENTQQTQIFEVQNTQKQNDKGDDVITTYYYDEENIFCIIQKEFNDSQRETTYYMQNNDLKLVIIKDVSPGKEIYYFVKDGEVLNTENLDADYSFEETVIQLQQLIEDF